MSTKFYYGQQDYVEKLNELDDAFQAGPYENTIIGDGVTDRSAAIISANSTGMPIKFVGISKVDSTVVITVPIVKTIKQIFTVGSLVTIDNGLPVRPEWFAPLDTSDAMKGAVNSLPSTGGVVLFRKSRYKSGFDSEANHLTKNNISFKGSKRPRVSDDDSRLEKGTVIEGPLAIYANWFCVEDLGVDAGSYVCNKYYGGAGQEGLWIANLESHPDATAPFVGFQSDNIQTLCVKGYAGHSFLCEYVTGAYVNNIRTKFGYHGTVFKAVRSYIQNIYNEDHPGNGTIIKSDNYADCSYSTFNNINIVSNVRGYGAGLTIIAATRSMGHINLSNIFIDNTSYGLDCAAAPAFTLEDVSVRNIEVTNSLTTGFNIRDNTNRVSIHDAISANSLAQGFYVQATSNSTLLENCRAIASGITGAEASGMDVRGFNSSLRYCTSTLNTGAGLYIENSQHIIGCNFKNNTNVDVYYGANGRCIGQDFLFNVRDIVLDVAGGWSSAGVTPRYWIENGRFHLSGMVGGGATSSVIFKLAFPNETPLRVMRFPVLTFNGTTSVLGELLIDPAQGNVSLAYGATQYVSLDNVSFSLAGN